MQTIPINTYDSPGVILELIYRLKIKDVMTSDPLTVSRSATMREIQQVMKEKKITGVPVVQGKRLLGIVSMDDIIQALDNGYINEKAEAHMTRNLIVLEDDMPLSFAISYFDRFSFHRFPVLNKRKELVGIISSRDITSSLLLEINKEVENLEKRIGSKRAIHALSDEVQTYSILKHDFENAGYASTQIKKRLKQAGIDTHTIRRAAIAAFELEINLVVHSDGGEIIAEYRPDSVIITSCDGGPGISDPSRALEKGWSTASEWIRSLGFGAGMGLPNVQSVSDSFSLETGAEGTTVISTIVFPQKQEGAKQ